MDELLFTFVRLYTGQPCLAAWRSDFVRTPTHPRLPDRVDRKTTPAEQPRVSLMHIPPTFKAQLKCALIDAALATSTRWPARSRYSPLRRHPPPKYRIEANSPTVPPPTLGSTLPRSPPNPSHPIPPLLYRHLPSPATVPDCDYPEPSKLTPSRDFFPPSSTSTLPHHPVSPRLQMALRQHSGRLLRASTSASASIVQAGVARIGRRGLASVRDAPPRVDKP